MCFVQTISVSRFELRSRHVCWKKTSPRRLVGQTRWILDTPVSTACNWSRISHSVFFSLGVNHLYLLLWFIAIVAFSVLTTIVHCLCKTDRPEDSACWDFCTKHLFPSAIVSSFTTTVVSASLCHHCFRHLAVKSLISLCLQWCDMYCRFSTVYHFDLNSLYHYTLSTRSTNWKISGND